MSASVATRSLPTARDRAQHGSASLDFDYWLAHCEGYGVRSAGGRVGIVEEVRRIAEDVDRAATLTVLAGMFGRRRVIIDAGQVDEIVPHEQCLILKPDATIVGTEPRE